MSEIDFKQVLADAGVPVTEDAAMLRLREIAAQENAPFNNLSPYSPFGRLLSLLFVKPLMWLVNVQYLEILPALFLKTARGHWVDDFAWQLGLTRKPATKAVGRITITRVDAGGLLRVPAGTVIQSAAIAGRFYRLQTGQDYFFPTGTAEITVLAEALETGAAYNLATGFYALIITALAGIAAVRNSDDWLVTPGADEETDDSLKQRCRNQFTAINQWHIDAAYKAMLSRWPGVAVDDIYIEHDAPRGPGTANAYILFGHGAPASQYLAEMTDYVMTQGNHGFSDDLLIAALPTYPLDVAAAVLIDPALPLSSRQAIVTEVGNFIRVAFRALPNTVFQPTRTLPFVRFNWSRLVMELHGQFPALVSVDFSVDTDIPAQLAQPALRNLTMTEMAA